MPLMLWLLGTAFGAEVVWLEPPPSADVADRVLTEAGATGPGVTLAAVAGRSQAWADERDGAALDALDTTLGDVRAFEQRLDGELLIMRDLQAPLAATSVIRDDKDRDAVFAALAYQGFAVERFFEDTLGSDARGEAFRATVGDAVVPAAWVDAVALDPDRSVTAYEIAEAPQRVAFERVRQLVRAALPATLGVPELPAGVDVVVDGRVVEPDAQRLVRTVPGRHFAHLVQDGRIIARWSGHVGAGDRVDLPLTAPAGDDWVRALPAPPTESVVRDLRTLGDEVWIVDPSSARPSGWRFSGGTFEPLELERARSQASISPTAGFAVGPGWMSTADYYRQDPVNTDPSFQTVNAAGLVIATAAGIDAGPLRVEAGVDVWWTPGEPHVAAWGGQTTHARAFPHLAVGIPEARAAVGWLTPHHLGLGPRLAVPIGPVEVVANGTVGLAVVGAPDAGTWSGAPVWSGWLGFGMRFDESE